MKLIMQMLLFLGVASVAQASVLSGNDISTGKKVEVDTQKSNKGTVVVFLSSKCPCSASHEVVLKDLAKQFPDFSFIGVNSNADEKEADVKAHFSQSALPFPVIRDNKSQLADQFKALKTPHAYVLNKRGETVYTGGVTNSHVGPMASQNYLKDALFALQNGQEPKVKEQRSLGCRISR